MGLILSKINEVPYLNIEYGKYKIELLILFFKSWAFIQNYTNIIYQKKY